MTFDTSEAFARKLDREDPLSKFRSEFLFPKTTKGEPVHYFAGNSLGLQPKRVRTFVEEELEDWARYGVEGHLEARHAWLPYHEFLTPSTAKIVGAKPSEVVVMNGLTVNLHLMLISFYRPTASRSKILIERSAFPSDRYAVASHAKLRGFASLESVIEPHDGQSIEEVIQERGDEIALVLVGNVNYLTGEAFDIGSITRAAHERGCLVGFDLAHGAGNLALELNQWGPDFAVWCSYKYLNAGPGAIAGCFVHERHHRAEVPKLEGWWGHDKERRFRFEPEFRAIPTVEAWQLSNPPILQLAALRASMELFDLAGMPALRSKSERLTAYLESWIETVGEGKLEILTPRDPARRGCQLSIRTTDGNRMRGRLRDLGVICDYREPGILRFAPTPLYNSYWDVCQLGKHLREAMQE